MADQMRPIPPAGAQAASVEQSSQPQVPPTPSGRHLESFFQQVVEGAKRFPATIAFSAIAALGISMLFQSIDTADELSEIIINLIVFGGIGAAVSVPARMAFERSKRGDDPVLAAFIPAVAALLMACLRPLAFDADRHALFFLACMGICICAAAMLLFVPTNEDNGKELFAHLVCSSVLAGFVSSLLQSGLMICVMAFSSLLKELDFGTYLSIPSFVSTVAYALVFCSQLPKLGDELRLPRAYRIIASYVVLPLCLLLLAVLYVYILRILIAWEMPVGAMNWFGSIALMVEIGLWLGLQPLDAKPAQLFARWGWALMLPVTAVQIYGVYVRVSAYGLTMLRAGGLVCLCVGLVALAVQAFRKSPRIFYAIVAAAALIFTVTPANPLDMAYLSQSARFSAALAEVQAGGSEDARIRLTSSWDYLHYVDNGYFWNAEVEGYRARAAKEDFEQLFGVEPLYEGYEEDSARPETYYRSFVDKSRVDVQGFSSFYAFDASAGKDGVFEIPSSEGEQLKVDLSPVVDGIAARGGGGSYETVDLAGTGEMTLDLADGTRIVLHSADIFYEDGDIQSVDVYGYVLVP